MDRKHCLRHESEVVALLELEQAAVYQLLGDREGQEGVLLPQQSPKVDVVLGRNAAGDYTVNPIHLKVTGWRSVLWIHWFQFGFRSSCYLDADSDPGS